MASFGQFSQGSLLRTQQLSMSSGFQSSWIWIIEAEWDDDDKDCNIDDKNWDDEEDYEDKYDDEFDDYDVCKDNKVEDDNYIYGYDVNDYDNDFPVRWIPTFIKESWLLILSY